MTSSQHTLSSRSTSRTASSETSTWRMERSKSGGQSGSCVDVGAHLPTVSSASAESDSTDLTRAVEEVVLAADEGR